MPPEVASTPPYMILWLLALYAFVLGCKFVFRRRGDVRLLGVGLLTATVCWMLGAWGIEIQLPLLISLPEGPKELVIPVLRTVGEIGLTLAIASATLVVIGAIAIASTGSDLIRLQKAVLRTLLLLIGAVVIWQMHFAGQFSLRNLLFGLGGASVFVIGLGLQRSMGNVFSGFDLQADKVVQRGDFVQLGVGGPEGIVADTSLRTTRIHSTDGQMMIVANADLLQRNLLNHDQPDRKLRVRRNVGVSYEVPPMRVKDAILGVLNQDQGVLQSPHAPDPAVFVQGYGDSAVNYEVRFWVGDRRWMDDVVDRVMTRIWYALREQSIEIPFPIRTIRMTDMPAEARRAESSEVRVRELEAAVARCPLFADAYMSGSERRELVRDSAECVLAEGELAVRLGERSEYMYLVLEGEVEVRPEGRASIRLPAPGWFGEIALLRREPRTADVAGGPGGARLLRMSRVSVLPALGRNPKLADELSRVSDARREAIGMVDTAEHEASVWRRTRTVVRSMSRSLRPW
ncbi:MAG: mechanosensitive ion channel [Planctomycetes bacterium]|nr:mechanosensitive ion channel [Planctomycetota bacterium]